MENRAMKVEDPLIDDQCSELSKKMTDFVVVVERCCVRLQESTENMEKRIGALAQTVRSDYFKQMLDSNANHIEAVSDQAVERVAKTVRWFYVERFLMTLLVSFSVAMVVALFDNDEWPWETHVRVKQERYAGQMLLQAWPTLTPEEQGDIVHMRAGATA